MENDLMHHFVIPVMVERRAMVNVEAVNLMSAVEIVQLKGVDSKVTGVSGININIVVDHARVEEFNPSYDYKEKEKDDDNR